MSDNDQLKSLEPLESEFATDPEMSELVEYFVSEMDDRIGSLRSAWETEDRDALQRLSHQLKGAATGYGYPQITDAAAELEGGLKSDGAISDFARAFDELVTLCKRASKAA